MRRLLLLTYAILMLASCRSLHAQDRPDRRGEFVVDRAEYPSGRAANAPIPPEMHIRNEGGSDGAGLCVISSLIANGQFQGVPGLDAMGLDERSKTQTPGKGSALWKAAKAAPGGYGPEKLARLVEQVMPGEKYASFVNTDTAILDRLSSEGYPLGVTMNTGALYQYQPIHHMVSLVDYSKKDNVAMVVDNNDPGRYHVMPATEFDKRWIDQGEGWVWIWTRKIKNKVLDGIAAPLILLTAAILVAVSRARQARDCRDAEYEEAFGDGE